MKLKVGDQVLVTTGKDKGRKGEIVKVFPTLDRVIVRGINLFTKHIKPYAGRAGEKKVSERPLPTANVAILNDLGQPDRIGFKVEKDGEKVRIFKKTGKAIESLKKTKATASKK